MLEHVDDVERLLPQILDIESVSGDERHLADLVQATLGSYDHLQVTRLGNVIVARTSWGRPERVVIAGHLDTVPVMDNLPSRRGLRDGRPAVYGRGAVDMKAGVAIQVNLAATLANAARDITWVFYDCEEVEATRNGLGHLVAARPDLIAGDLAILMEPTGGRLEGGCQGTLRAEIRTYGVAAHSARSWLGHDAIHDMADALAVLRRYESHTVMVDGLAYREGLNAVGISGGVAGNVIPDRCQMLVNYRFAPDKSVEEATAIVREAFAGYELEIVDAAAGARPGLSQPAVASLVRAVGVEVAPKYGWTDVARFAAQSIPGINWGPGDPNLAHTVDENVLIDEVLGCRDALRGWLIGAV
ncbi:MAG: succinyl-diaminopimelate desuccinylase [Propionibacteriaceae bacterium]|jgi:succinyl-diaminopimelate desuccinylase|nr:succinyl-diaminopimelate desuccinylase [Propionibacteriaceae bacterium]